MITIENIMDLSPCYDRESVQELFGDRESVTLMDILDCEEIPAKDRVWAVTQLIPEQQAREAACQFAESVLHLFEREYPDDSRPRQAIEAARAYSRGEIGYRKLNAARASAAAAYYAVYAARAARAARAAAYAAYAARSAADAGHAAAAYAASAARAADATYATYARTAERQKQLQILKGICSHDQ